MTAGTSTMSGTGVASVAMALTFSEKLMKKGVQNEKDRANADVTHPISPISEMREEGQQVGVEQSADDTIDMTEGVQKEAAEADKPEVNSRTTSAFNKLKAMNAFGL